MLKKGITEILQSLLSALLKGDSDDVGRILDAYLESSRSIQSLYLDVIGKVQSDIGELWEKGKVTVPEEHRSTQILVDHLSRIRRSIRARKPLGLKCVISALDGDNHFLGARMISDLLILDGWDVDFLGSNTPVEDLLNHCKAVNASLLGISISFRDNISNLDLVVSKIRTLLPNLKIIIGGRAITKADCDKYHSSDVILSSSRDIIADARKLVGISTSLNTLHQTLSEIGSRIHFHRKALKMSQEKLASGSGLDRAYISSVENGKQNVTIGALLKLADTLGVDLLDLMQDPGSPLQR